MSTMVNLGIGFQEPLTRPGVKLDEKMSNYSSDSERSRGIYKFQLAGICISSFQITFRSLSSLLEFVYPASRSLSDHFPACWKVI